MKNRVLSLCVFVPLLSFVLFLLGGCWAVFPSGVPINTRALLEKEEHPADHGRGLIVLLPGGSDSLEDFERKGFVEEVERSGLPLDVVAADAHYGYIRNRTVVQRLQHDVLVPAREKGYFPIYVVGISIGALAAGLYALQHPEAIEGVLLLAPSFDRRTVAESAERVSGRTRSWQADLWRWIRERAPSTDPDLRPFVALGFGEQDRFIETLDALARSFPSERLYRSPGGHDWPAWRAGFRGFLEYLKHR
jgi:pimeloyl-ACP methyl ester carboxylesterase